MTLPDPLITHSEAVLSGAAVVNGTRVPVQTLNQVQSHDVWASQVAGL